MRRLTWIWVVVLLFAACDADTQELVGKSSITAATPTTATSTTLVSSTTTTEPSVTTTVAKPREFTVEVIGPSETADLSWVAVAVGPDDLPFVSFTDAQLGDQTLVHCLDPACTSRAYSTIVIDEKLWQPPSVHFGPDGFPVVMTPPTAANHFLTVHDCNDRPCTSTNQTRFATSRVGWVDVVEDGTTFIGILDGDPLLRIFQCSDPGCGQGATEIRRVTEWVRSFILSENGLPIMVTERSVDSTGRTGIHVIQCSTQDCSSTKETLVAADLEVWSLSVDPLASDGGTAALIAGSHGSAQLVLVTWRDDDPATASQVIIDNLAPDEGELQTPAVAVGPNGHPVIVWKRVYYESETLDEAIDLMVARCTTPDCTAGTISTIARGVNHCSHGFTAVAVDAADLPILVYHVAADDGAVVLASCGDPTCTGEAIEVGGWPTR